MGLWIKTKWCGYFLTVMKTDFMMAQKQSKGQCSSLVTCWLSVPGDHGSNLGGGENVFLFCF